MVLNYEFFYIYNIYTKLMAIGIGLVCQKSFVFYSVCIFFFIAFLNYADFVNFKW